MKNLFKLINQLQELRQIPQFLYYDAINPNGVIEFREKIYSLQKSNANAEEIDFIIQSPGGSADDAYRIIKFLRSHYKVVNVVIPFWAKSAATLLSFGGTKIIMDEFGEFGPLDTQLPKENEDSPYYDRESALVDQISLKSIEDRGLELYRLMFVSIYRDKLIPINKTNLSEQLLNFTSKFYEPLLNQINPYKIGEKQRKLDIAVQYARLILTRFNKIHNNVKDLLIDSLVNDYPDHGFIIDREEISKYLPNVIFSEKISSPYSQTLSQVSSYFMCVEEDERFIGFIEFEKDSKAQENVVSKTEPIIENLTKETNGEDQTKVHSK